MADKMAKGLVHMQNFAGVAPDDRVAEPLADRIRARIQITESGCWEWQGALSDAGYGRISVGSRRDQSYRIALVHRVSYETFVGPIPDGLVIDHLCRNRACCNPEHLEPVTQRVNVVVRGHGPVAAQALQTHCKNGHEFTEANTWLSPKTGKKGCRVCRRKNPTATRSRR